jgi:hypothetical protein
MTNAILAAFAFGYEAVAHSNMDLATFWFGAFVSTTPVSTGMAFEDYPKLRTLR